MYHRAFPPVFVVASAALVLLIAACTATDAPPATDNQPPPPEMPAAGETQTLIEPERDGDLHVERIVGPSGVSGYLARRRLDARSGTFDVRVEMDPQFQVRYARVTEYRAVRGGGIDSPRFTRQFAGKGPDDPIRVGEDIDGVTGATISAEAMARGVRQIIRRTRLAAGR